MSGDEIECILRHLALVHRFKGYRINQYLLCFLVYDNTPTLNYRFIGLIQDRIVELGKYRKSLRSPLIWIGYILQLKLNHTRSGYSWLFLMINLFPFLEQL